MPLTPRIDDEAIDALDEPGLRRMRTVATVMDDAVRIPVINYRVGFDPLLGLLPVSGDTVAAAISLYIVAEAARLGVPLRTLVRMVVYVALDFFAGSIPGIGPALDAVLKVNLRNVELARRSVERQRERARQSDEVPIRLDLD